MHSAHLFIVFIRLPYNRTWFSCSFYLSNDIIKGIRYMKYVETCGGEVICLHGYHFMKNSQQKYLIIKIDDYSAQVDQSFRLC